MTGAANTSLTMMPGIFAVVLLYLCTGGSSTSNANHSNLDDHGPAFLKLIACSKKLNVDAFEESNVTCPHLCFRECYRHKDCRAVNVKIITSKEYVCEILAHDQNSVSADHLVEADGYFYYDLGKSECGECKRYLTAYEPMGYMCDCTHLSPLADCEDFYNAGYRSSGIFTIQMEGDRTYNIFCDMMFQIEGERTGGWTVIQKRHDGSQDFYKNWQEYKDGFGDRTSEYYMGNYFIHNMTKYHTYELAINVEAFNGERAYALYRPFSITDEADEYRLNVAFIAGTAGDSLTYHNKMAFSTHDRDNDRGSGHCGKKMRGGWWYNDCKEADLNSIYFHYETCDSASHRHIEWRSFRYRKCIKSSHMLIRKIRR